ncbi:hypothetical protein A6E15_10055 [Natrinema saccharevitans]|uniref:Uncharacterized protein n=1 Tax=Natrinema saccharevitans TaxID=301967 RepID=A0A1S8AXM8_9EURY|nr:hypothetical protein [Natrinema saccharevitans]OLZ41309.1 hypothetical protein A6E15_10055 [Natrinema saccharevitans]
MTSRDPDELKEELEEIEFSGDVEMLSDLRAEARETVNSQRKTLNDIDTKASKILRLNITLIGILVSVLSIAAQNDSGSDTTFSAAEPFVNTPMKIGIGSLVISTAFAAVTYTASELDVGVSSDNLTALLQAEFSQEDVEELLVKNHIARINFNRSTNIRNIPLIQLTIIFVVSSVVFFALGIYDAVIGPLPKWLSAAALIVLICVTVVSGLPMQLVRAVRDIREWR